MRFAVFGALSDASSTRCGRFALLNASQTRGVPHTNLPALAQSPRARSSFSYSICFQFLLHCVVHLCGHGAIQGTVDPCALSRATQAFYITADIRAASRPLARKIKRDHTLGITDNTKQFSLRSMLVASETLTHGDLFFLFYRCIHSALISILKPVRRAARRAF